MKIGDMIREKQPSTYDKLNRKPQKQRIKADEDLSFNDFERMMQHSSYKRVKGGSFKQVRQG